MVHTQTHLGKNMKIKENAPKGATHYEIEGRSIYYYKFNNINLYIWNKSKGWILKPIEWAKDIKPL